MYEKYADDMLKPNGRQRLITLLQRIDVGLTFQSAGHGFKDAVKYVLPKLLLGPIYHCLHYFEMIKVTKYYPTKYSKTYFEIRKIIRVCL